MAGRRHRGNSAVRRRGSVGRVDDSDDAPDHGAEEEPAGPSPPTRRTALVRPGRPPVRLRGKPGLGCLRLRPWALSAEFAIPRGGTLLPLRGGALRGIEQTLELADEVREDLVANRPPSWVKPVPLGKLHHSFEVVLRRLRKIARPEVEELLRCTENVQGLRMLDAENLPVRSIQGTHTFPSKSADLGPGCKQLLQRLLCTGGLDRGPRIDHDLDRRADPQKLLQRGRDVLAVEMVGQDANTICRARRSKSTSGRLLEQLR